MSLLQQHDWVEISIRMICDRADVARSTFYVHFDTKQDLLDAAFSIGAAQMNLGDNGGGLDGTLFWLADHLGQSRGFHRRLGGSPAGLSIMARFRTLIGRRLAHDLAAEGITPSPATLNFVIGGTLQMIEGWMAAESGIPAKTIATQAAQLIRKVCAA